MLLLHYLVKCRSHILAVYNSEFILGIAHASAQKITVRPQKHLNPVDYAVWSVLQERVYRTKISDVDELKRCINSEWAALSHAVIERAVGEWRQRLYALASVLEAEICSVRIPPLTQ